MQPVEGRDGSAARVALLQDTGGCRGARHAAASGCGCSRQIPATAGGFAAKGSAPAVISGSSAAVVEAGSQGTACGKALTPAADAAPAATAAARFCCSADREHAAQQASSRIKRRTA